MKVYEPAALESAPPLTFLSKELRSKDLAGHRMTIEVAPDDCTGCGVCVDVCPAHSKTEVRHKSIRWLRPWTTVTPSGPIGTSSCRFPSSTGISCPMTPPRVPRPSSLFEFSGACAGCGETPYLKLLTQLFGDRIVVGNATGCSSIYGGNLPTTPWAQKADGWGPACSRGTGTSPTSWRATTRTCVALWAEPEPGVHRCTVVSGILTA
jgi:pyruvate-ferredoxin/flavodoxin oxidoreductase